MYLLSILHYHNNPIEKDKVQPILEYFNERCRQIVEPENNLSIDEQMVRYKGTTARTSYRQYMPKKPTKRGFKVWTRCRVSAFMYEMILYRGVTKVVSSRPSLPDSSLKRTSRNAAATIVPTNNSTINSHRETLLKDYGSSEMVVLDLIKNVPAGSSIFIDNYFSSTKLLKNLTELGYRVTCTLRPNRIQGCPISTEKQFDQKKRGYYEYFISDNNIGLMQKYPPIFFLFYVSSFY